MDEFWNYGSYPTEHGWYPVLICHDMYEGAFPGSAYWSDRWEVKGVIAFGRKQPTQYEAITIAYEHDPDQ